MRYAAWFLLPAAAIAETWDRPEQAFGLAPHRFLQVNTGAPSSSTNTTEEPTTKKHHKAKHDLDDLQSLHEKLEDHFLHKYKYNKYRESTTDEPRPQKSIFRYLPGAKLFKEHDDIPQELVDALKKVFQELEKQGHRGSEVLSQHLKNFYRALVNKE